MSERRRLITKSLLGPKRREKVDDLFNKVIDPSSNLAHQGGIAETSRATSHSAPIYIEEGVVHYCVPNMPAACARTASLALERSVLPYIRIILESRTAEDLRTGIQVKAGKVTHEHLARDTGRAYSPL